MVSSNRTKAQGGGGLTLPPLHCKAWNCGQPPAAITGGMLFHSQQAPRALWHKADGFGAGTILLMGG